VILLSLIPLPSRSQGCLSGGFTPTTQTEIDNFQTNYPGCTVIEGDVFISGTGFTNLNGLSVITKIQGKLEIVNTNMVNLQGLENLEKIDGHLMVNSLSLLTSLTGLNKLDTVSSAFNLAFLPALQNITGLINLRYINTLEISHCDLLPDLTGLNNVGTIGAYIYIHDNNILSSLDGLDHFFNFGGSYCDILSNPILSDCAVKGICDIIAIHGAAIDIGTNAPNCNSWEEVESICMIEATAAAVVGRGKGVAINIDGSSPDSSAILDIKSSSSALLIPRLSATEKRAIIDPQKGAVIFDKSRNEFYFYGDTSWIPVDHGMGDHKATSFLDMNSYNINGVNTILADQMSTHTFILGKKFYDKHFYEGDSTQILSSTGTGVDWIDLPNMSDNLGNHMATQNLNMSGFDIFSIDEIFVDGYYYDENGNSGGTGQILSSTASGTDWIDLPNMSDNLGNHIATQNINLSGNWLSGNGDNEGIYLDNSNRIGIGSNSPDAQLHIVHNTGEGTPFYGYSGLVIQNNSTGESANLVLTSSRTGSTNINLGDVDGVGTGAIAYDNSSNKMFFKTNGVSQVAKPL